MVWSRVYTLSPRLTVPRFVQQLALRVSNDVVIVGRSVAVGTDFELE